jgi:hypothetical protein
VTNLREIELRLGEGAAFCDFSQRPLIDQLLGDNEAAFRLGDGDAVFFRRLEPEGYRFFSIRDRFSARIPMCHSTGKLRHINDEGVILGTPPNDHFVTRCFYWRVRSHRDRSHSRICCS